jgi:hypothetical protein
MRAVAAISWSSAFVGNAAPLKFCVLSNRAIRAAVLGLAISAS